LNALERAGGSRVVRLRGPREDSVMHDLCALESDAGESNRGREVGVLGKKSRGVAGIALENDRTLCQAIQRVSL